MSGPYRTNPGASKWNNRLWRRFFESALGGCSSLVFEYKQRAADDWTNPAFEPKNPAALLVTDAERIADDAWRRASAGSACALFVLADDEKVIDGGENVGTTTDRALQIEKAADDLARALGVDRYKGKIEGAGAGDVVTTHRALCHALYGKINPPDDEDNSGLVERNVR